MDIDFPLFDNDHLLGNCAMRPIAPRLTRQSRHTQAHSTAVSRIIELAAWTHSEWLRIHPLRNGSGRTARMLTNAILMRCGLPPVLRLRPRPPSPYGYAGAEGMEGNPKPMENLLRKLLKDFPKED